MNQKLIVAIISLVLAIFLFGLGYHFGKTKIMSDNAIKTVDKQKENDKLKDKLEDKHEKDKTTINTVAATKPNRVRLPSCPKSSNPVPSETSSSGVPQVWVLSEQAERVMDSDRQRTQEIIREAELELSSCRAVVEWSLKQGD